MYMVSVSTGSSAPKAITAFSFLAANNLGVLLADATGMVIGQSISVSLPPGTNVANLVATFTTTGQSVTVGPMLTPQTSGVTPNDFTSPVTYTVHATDSSTAMYMVSVSTGSSAPKAITAFSFLAANNLGVLLADATGMVIGQSISVSLPPGTNVANLVATFTTTRQSVTVGPMLTPQTSGVTPNDFTSPVTYTVHATDSSTAMYMVSVSTGSSAPKAITAFSFLMANNPVLLADATGMVIGQSISVSLPPGTNVANLVATFTTTGQSVTVGPMLTPQTSGVTPNDFTSPVTYTVHATDSSTAMYMVSVSTGSSAPKAITAFSFLAANNLGVLLADATGMVIGQSISVSLPPGTNVANLVATFTTTGQSRS